MVNVIDVIWTLGHIRSVISQAPLCIYRFRLGNAVAMVHWVGSDHFLQSDSKFGPKPSSSLSVSITHCWSEWVLLIQVVTHEWKLVLTCQSGTVATANGVPVCCPLYACKSCTNITCIQDEHKVFLPARFCVFWICPCEWAHRGKSVVSGFSFLGCMYSSFCPFSWSSYHLQLTYLFCTSGHCDAHLFTGAMSDGWNSVITLCFIVVAWVAVYIIHVHV